MSNLLLTKTVISKPYKLEKHIGMRRYNIIIFRIMMVRDRLFYDDFHLPTLKINDYTEALSEA